MTPVTTQAYLYKWTEISTGKWYIGSRTAKGCHPNDGYICSSKSVKPLIVENKDEWKREILVIGNPEYILELEERYLTELDARNNKESYNKHNGNGDFTMAGKIGTWKGKSTWNKGLDKSDPRVALNASNSSATKQERKTPGLSGDKNGMYGKTPWNKGLDKSDPRVLKYSTTLKESGNRKNKCTGDNNPARRPEVQKKISENLSGKNNYKWQGYFISPEGTVYESAKEAGKATGHADHTISRWAKAGKKGWKFINKTDINNNGL
jgi:hypothetical protein